MSSAVLGRPGLRADAARLFLRGEPATAAVQRQNVRYETIVTRCRIALPTADPNLMRRAFSRAVRVRVVGSLARRIRFSSLRYSTICLSFASSEEAKMVNSGWRRRSMVGRGQRAGI